jgi:hypothetical protein
MDENIKEKSTPIRIGVPMGIGIGRDKAKDR